MLGCVIFVATRSNGIYTYNTDTEEVVLFISENKIRTMDLAKTDALFVTTDTECIFYDIINGAIIERYKTLYNRYQVPLFTKVTGDYIFVIGETYNAAPTDQYLHAWKLDKSGLSYNQIDGALPKNKRVLGGMVSCYSSVYDDIYFVLKSFEGNSIVHYNDKLELEEKPFGFSTDNLIQVNSDEYLFFSGNSVYYVRDNITEQIEFNMGFAKFLGILYGTFYIISGNTIRFFTLGKLDSSSTTLRYKVFDSAETCNNIEILIDGDNLKDINLLDDADIPIRPSYKTTVDSMTYIKLINCKVNKVFISVSVDSASLIRGIVCRSNKLYLR